MQFNIKTSDRCDATIDMKGRKVDCFSPKYIKNTYPQGGCKVLGEIAGDNAKKMLGTMQLGHQLYNVVPSGTNSRLLWRSAGYLQVGDDHYVAVLKSRVPFIIILTALIGAGILLLLLMKGPAAQPNTDLPNNPGGNGPVIIDPDHPLPPVDDNSQKLEDDDSEKTEVEEGGGSVSMIYSLDASLTLSNGDITIYFKNPNASSHNVTLDMYVVSGGQEYLIASSGLLEAGFGLSKLQMVEDAPTLSEGIYTGLFRLHCFDPLTGEQALVVPEITGLNITVKNG